MSLSQYIAPQDVVQVPKGKPFHVEGLSLSGLAILVRTHLSDLDAVFDLFTAGEKVEPHQLNDFLADLITQAPGLVANIIAVAAGEPDATKQAEKLPFAVQLDALVKIGELTFTEPGSVKKFLEQVALLLGKMGMEKKMLTMPVAKKTAKRR